jgi:3-hydroxy-9,10-secoandrosta-1,3,5(10)-triene-9,17-dione monooxygenase reductase component
MRHTRRFAVNVLGRRHQQFATRASAAGADRFTDLDWQPGHNGLPLLTDALATLECAITAEHPTGDHWIVVGHVNTMHIPPITDPLIFFAGAFGALKPAQRDPARPTRRLRPSPSVTAGACER